MNVHELEYSLDMIDSVADDLVQLLPLVSVLTFAGPLGAGKTTLISALLNKCGINEDIQSPTFSYLNTYANAEGQTFYHFDLYRLKSLQDFLAANFDEYLYQPNSWALIEWPEIIEPLLKKRVCNFVIDYDGFNKRRMRYSLIE